MANGDLTNPTTASGATDYSSYVDQLKKTAAQTRDVGATGVPSGATKAVGALGGVYKGIGEAALTSHQRQAAAIKKQSDKAASALELQGGATINYLQQLDQIRAGVTAKAGAAKQAFGEAAEKADEYVKAARGRVGEVLNKLDDINSEISRNRDFSKAHAMQASVQATLGSMKAEERNILENYGGNSKEYQQFVASKQNALGVVQSNIHATYQQLQEEQGRNYLNVVSDAYTKSNMYVGFQEQQHVDMLKYKAEAQNAYDLQVSQFEVGIEQMKAAGMENLANWMVESPTFSMDDTPLMTILGDLAQAQAAEMAANRAMTSQESARPKRPTFSVRAGIPTPQTQASYY